MVGIAGTALAQPPPPDSEPRSCQAVVNVAHRGGIVPGTPENTLAAFRQAIAHGAQVIEIDLRGTKDGAIVVMHDATVDRTTNGHGRVSDLTRAEVQALDAGRGERVPTYEDVLALVNGRGVQLLLDIKEGPSLDKREVVRLTHLYGATLDVIVGPRSVEDLRAFQALDPNLRTLGFIARPDDLDAFIAAGVHIIRLWPDWIARDPGLVSRVHGLGRPVWTTAGQAGAEQLQELLARGVNGVLTDDPALLRELLERTR
jgi:glycerophosphoryl diester phosphodiesterase